MKRTFSGILVAALAFAGVVGTSTKADAAFMLWVCNDASCTGGDDYSVADNATNNTLGLTGDENAQLNNIAIDGSIFGYTVTTVGTFSLNNAVPDMDLGWVVRNVGATTPLWLYATQTGFTTLGTANATFSSTIDGGTATGTVRGSDGDANNSANLTPILLTLPINAPGGFTQGSAALVGPSPYSFAIGVTLNQTGASSGDLRVRVVPEPASMTLFGLGLMGFGVASRRRKANQAK